MKKEVQSRSKYFENHLHVSPHRKGGREKEIKMDNVKIIVSTRGKEIDVEEMMEEKALFGHALKVIGLMKDIFREIKQVRYLEFPFEEEKVLGMSWHSQQSLKMAISTICDISNDAETVIYYAGCGCCGIDEWRDKIIDISPKPKKIILVHDIDFMNIRGCGDYFHGYLKSIRDAGISLIDVSLDDIYKKKEAVE
jgi:hypothetical protein